MFVCMLQYSVVIFTEGKLNDSVVVLPSSWLLQNRTKAYWPSFPTGKVYQRQRLILALAEPLTEWPIEEIKYCHSYRTWNLAQEAAKKQTKQEDAVSSEPDNCGKGKRTKFKPKYPWDTSSSSESENNCPASPPKKSKKIDKIKKKSGPSANLEISRLSESENDCPASPPKKSKKIDKIKKKSAPSGNLEISPSIDKMKALLALKPQTVGAKISKPGQNRFTSSPSTSQIKSSHKTSSTTQLRPENVLAERRDNEDNTDEMTAENRIGQNSFTGSARDHETSSTTNLCQENDLAEQQEKEHNDTMETGEYSNEGFGSPVRFNTGVPSPSTQSSSNLGLSASHPQNFVDQSSSKTVAETSSGRKKSTTISSNISELKSSRSRESIVVAEILEEINSKIDIQGMNVAKILQCVDPEEAVIERPQGLPSLPLANEAAFLEFEKFLKIPTNSTATSLYLSGKLFDQTVPYKGAQKLLRSIISNNLARTISWEGTHGLKISFKTTKCAEVVRSAILRRFSEKHMGLVKHKIQKWFDNSQGRKVSARSPVPVNENESSTEDIQ